LTIAVRSGLASYKGAAVRKVIAVYDKPFRKDLPREGAVSNESVRAPGIGHGERMATELGRIFLAGTESSDEFSGYVEGALASAERAVRCTMRITGST
jgi:hypothetical protein